MSCGVGHRHGWDPMLLWLLHRPAATAPIGPLAWEPPHAAGAALEKTKKKKKKQCYATSNIFQNLILVTCKNADLFGFT